jgi:hypothetical protein
MTKIEKTIVAYIEKKFGFPYLYYNIDEQTWSNEFFLFDIKTSTMYCSDEFRDDLNKKYGKGYIDNVILIVMSEWFKYRYKHQIEQVV